METPEEILEQQFPTPEGNPDTERIIEAMKEFGRQVWHACAVDFGDGYTYPAQKEVESDHYANWLLELYRSPRIVPGRFVIKLPKAYTELLETHGAVEIHGNAEYKYLPFCFKTTNKEDIYEVLTIFEFLKQTTDSAFLDLFMTGFRMGFTRPGKPTEPTSAPDPEPPNGICE